MKTKLLLVFAFLAFQSSFADPIAPALAPMQYCDPNNDGFGVFDLDSLTPIIVAAQSGNASDFVVTYHEVPNDAQIGVMPVGSPYNNIDTWSQIIYYRVRQISNNTYATGEVKLNVTPVPVAESPTDLTMCDYNNNGVGIFDFAPLIQQILGGVNPATATVTFHSSLASAQAGLSPIAPINSYVGTNGQTIYARLTYNATGCYDVVSFQLHVEPLPLSMQPNYPPYALCDANEPIGYETFDLGSQINAIALGQVGVDVTFYPSLGDAENGTNLITNLQYVNTVQYVQTLGIRLTNHATGCYVISTMDIMVNPLPNLIPPITPYSVCDDNQDGFASFDLTSLVAGLIQGSTVNVTFHETQMEAEIGANPLTSPYYNINPFVQVLYVRGYENLSGCYSVIQIELYVNPAPIAPVSLSSIATCDSDSNPNNGTTSVNLTQRTTDILAQQSLPASNYSVTYYHSQIDAVVGISPIIPATNYIGTNGETIWCRVVINSTGCYAVGSFNLIVNAQPFAIGPQIYSSCDNYGDPYDGVTTLDLTQFESAILNGQNGAIYLVSYYANQSDAIAGVNALTPSQEVAYVTNPDTDTIWVKVQNTNNSIQPFCYALTTIDISVDRYPNPIINTVNNLNSICVDYITGAVTRSLTLNSGIANPSAYTFEWYEAGNPLTVIGTASTYTVNTPSNGATRNYNVRVRANGALGCQRISSSFSVIQSGQASISTGTDGYTITNLSGVHSITVAISGYGSYEYSLDAGPRQTSNVFENVSLGNHTITVWDTEGGTIYSCDPLIISDVQIEASQVPAPTGVNLQTFSPGATLADIVVNGTDIQWYASPSTKNNLSTMSVPLPLSTVLVDGVTYYATQTLGGIESTAYLPVTVQLTLNVDDHAILSIQYAPNPVKNSLALKSMVVLKSVTIYTMLGQKVFEQDCNASDVIIDLSNLTTGNYILKAQGETGEKTIRIIKE